MVVPVWINSFKRNILGIQPYNSLSDALISFLGSSCLYDDWMRSSHSKIQK